MEKIATEKVNLAVADGSTMDAFVARPRGHGKYPGILVFQEAFGVTAHIRDIAERFARIGLVAIAPESAEAAFAALQRHGVSARRVGKVLAKRSPLLAVE